jgi:hypothetical protein
MATAQLSERPASMSNDIRSILDRLATVEGRLSPAQQKVPQLPALFKPKHIRALGSKTDPAHPMDGYMVGDSIEPRRTALEEAMAEIEEDMLSKVKKDLTKYLDKLEKKVSINRDLKDKAKDAVERGRAEEEIEEFAPPGDDGSGDDGFDDETLKRMAALWWQGDEDPRIEQTLAAAGWEIGQDEGYDNGGVFVVQAGDVNGNSYISWPAEELEGLAEEIDSDPAAMQGPSDLGDTETAHDIELGIADKLNAPQKPQAPQATFEMADGKSMDCYGDDNSGYELRHGGKALPSRFKSLDDAGMAVKLYQARQRAQQRAEQDPSQDYIEER